MRSENLKCLREAPLDVLILGGGINGAGVARDLALRARHAGAPLRIGLVEQGHFASGTSGKNSQLIHGGLRYLKYFEFRLVREALRERATLVKLAPHLVEPLQFLMPIESRFAQFYYEAGLYLYDFLAGSRNIGRHKRLSRTALARLEPGLAAAHFGSGALFYDCRINSARFVLANIFDAMDHGAMCVNYVRAEDWARDDDGLWRVPLADALSGERFEIRARKLVDTTGPWAKSLRLVRGSHIILPRITAGSHAIAYFEPAGRIVFFIPWGNTQPLTLVGTTDVDHTAGPDAVSISTGEVQYLLSIACGLFPAARGAEPISAYSSLRPLLQDESGSPTAASREHRIWRSDDGIVHVAGGKYTTYRVMSEEAADLVAEDIAPQLKSAHLTESTPLAKDTPEVSLQDAVEHEMAQRLRDVFFVSTYWGYEQRWSRESLAPYAREMGALCGWDQARQQEEVESVLSAVTIPTHQS